MAQENNRYTFTGIVTEVLDTQSIGQNGFTKREFRVKEDKDSKYPNFVAFILKKDKCSLADSLTEGAKVTVHFSLNGRIWTPDDDRPTRCFVDLEAWKIDILERGKPAPPPAEPEGDVGDFNDDVPF